MVRRWATKYAVQTAKWSGPMPMLTALLALLDPSLFFDHGKTFAASFLRLPQRFLAESCCIRWSPLLP